MCFMTHQAVFLSASWLYHKCFIPLFLNKHLRDESVEMSIQRKIFLEGSLDFKKVNSASIGATWPYQASSIMSHISIHCSSYLQHLALSTARRSHKMSHIVGTKNCKIKRSPDKYLHKTLKNIS